MEANNQITQLTREAEVTERATTDLQRQLEVAHRLDYSSVYESVDNLRVERLESADGSQVKKDNMYCSTNFPTRMYIYILEDVQLSRKGCNLVS